MPLVNVVVLLRIEHAADRWLHAEHREIVSGNELGLHALGRIVDAQRGLRQSTANHLGQRLGPLLEVLIHRVRVHPGAGIAAHIRGVLVQHDELVRRADRQLAQDDLIEEGEDRGICADSQRQRQDRHRGEERVPAKAAQRKPQVGECRVHAWAILLFDGAHVLKVVQGYTESNQ